MRITIFLCLISKSMTKDDCNEDDIKCIDESYSVSYEDCAGEQGCIFRDSIAQDVVGDDVSLYHLLRTVPPLAFGITTLKTKMPSDERNDVAQKHNGDSFFSIQHLLKTVPIPIDLTNSLTTSSSIYDSENSMSEISLQHLLKTVPIPIDLTNSLTTPSSIYDSENSNSISEEPVSEISLRHLLKTVPIPMNILPRLTTPSSTYNSANSNSISEESVREIYLQHLLKTVPIPINILTRLTTPSCKSDENKIPEDKIMDISLQHLLKIVPISLDSISRLTTPSSIYDSQSSNISDGSKNELSLQHLLRTVPVDLPLRSTTPSSISYTDNPNNVQTNKIFLQHLLKTVPIPIDLISRTTTEVYVDKFEESPSFSTTITASTVDTEKESDCSEDDLKCIDDFYSNFPSEYEVTTSFSGNESTTSKTVQGKLAIHFYLLGSLLCKVSQKMHQQATGAIFF